MTWAATAMALAGGPSLFAREEPLVSITASASHLVVAPGTEGRLSLLAVPRKGWHIYWHNPGDSGLPPKVEWKGPRHTAVGPLILPFPEVFRKPEETTFGFSGPVKMISRFRVGRGAPINTQVTFRAAYSLMACKDGCEIMEGEAVISLPTGLREKVSPKAAELRTMDIAAHRPFPGTLSAVGSRKGITLQIRTNQALMRVNQALFIPSIPMTVSHSAPQALVSQGDSWSLSLPLSEFASDVPRRISGCLRITFNGQEEDFLVRDLPVALSKDD